MSQEKCSICDQQQSMDQKFHAAWERLPEEQRKRAEKLAAFTPFVKDGVKIVPISSLKFPSDQIALAYVVIYSVYKIEMAPLIISKITDKKLLEYLLERFKDDNNPFTGKKVKECAEAQLQKLS